MLDKLRKSPYGLAVWVGIVSVLHIVLFKDKINNDYQIVQRILIAFVAIIFTLPMHELVHFVFFKMFSKSSVKIKLGRDPIGLPSLVTECRDDITKRQKVLSYLAPFLFLTMLLDISFGFCAKVELIFFVVAMCNSVGCYFDLIETLMMLRRKKSD